MDSGRPFRITRPDDNQGRPPARPVVTRPAETAPVTDAPTQVKAVPVAESKEAAEVKSVAVRHTRPKRGKKLLRAILLSVGVLVIVAIVALLARQFLATGSELPGVGKYQAVTTVDGQIFFGKIKTVGTKYVEIDSGYYLQPAANATTANGQPDTGKLVLLSNRLYTPSGDIVIPITQIISFEPLDPDGQIVQMMNK